MAKPIKTLTDTFIKNIKPTDKLQTFFDGGGLYFEVRPSGVKSWRMKARFNGKPLLLSFGQYPAVSLRQAREKRAEAQTMIQAGKDPREVKREQLEQERAKTEHTFEKIARDWHTNRLSGWKESTAKDTIGRLERDVFPLIGQTPINDVSHQQVIDILRRIEARGAKEIAKRLKANLARIFSYAIQHGICDRNVAADLTDILQPAAKKHFASIKHEELPALVKALEGNKARLFIPTRIAVQLMLLLFVRTSELIEGEWSEIDMENGVWIIPWQRMKMGKKKINPVKTDHRIDLPKQAIVLLEELKEVTGGSKYLFPNQRDHEKPMSNGAILMALRRTGYQGKMTGHGFRALAASALEELGYRREVIDRQLAHKPSDKIQAAYFRADFQKERKEMLQYWANYIDSLKGGQFIQFKKQA